MNCPVCNAPNIDGATFCDNCGTKLGAHPAPPPVPIQASVPAVQAGGMVCPSCQSPVIPGTAFCDICGAAIPSVAPMPAAVPPMPAPPPQQVPAGPQAPVPPPGGQVRCGSCGSMNAAGQAFCDNCGQSLRAGGPAPQPVGVPQAPVMPGVKLTVAASGVAFDLTGKTQAIIGRVDPVSGVNPDVDLTPHGGDEGGVSRRHAELSFNGYQWQIKDLNSTNGTAVNNQRLAANVPQPLNNGDQIRVGKVALVFQAG